MEKFGKEFKKEKFGKEFKKEKIGEVEEAKEMLMKMDPELALAAIQQKDIDLNEVDRIKEFLNQSKPEAVQVALAEIQQEVRSEELKRIKEAIKDLSSETLKQAAIELGIFGSSAYCTIDGPDPSTCGACIALMTVRCPQEMVMTSKLDIVTNNPLKQVFEEAVFKALNRANIR